jgi:signal transduction histidine kinase
MDHDSKITKSTSLPGRLTGLSSKLVLLTVIFVMLAEFMIWAPSVARYRKDFLEEYIAKAHLAMVAVGALKPGAVEDNLEMQLLFYTNTHGIALNYKDHRMLIVGDTMPPKVDLEINLSHGSFMGWVGDAFETLAQNKNRVLRVIGYLPNNDDVRIEIVIDESRMRQEMIDFSGRILGLSIVISLFTAALVFFSLQWLMVRPIRRITRNLELFREQPEDENRVIMPTRRSDELGVAQRELRVMQEEVRYALQQKTRLATLGAAVARVNHDLRNTLATAVLASDRLSKIDEPEVQRVMPRLYTAIDRAVRLCSQTLDYVSFSDLKLHPDLFHLTELITEVEVALRDPGMFSTSDNNNPLASPNTSNAAMVCHNDISFEISIMADRHQLYRVFHNLGLNAQLAGAKNLTFKASINDHLIEIDLIDDGPGLPEQARDNLFESFVGSSRTGGTGLGLVIARDIINIHGGHLRLLKTDKGGTTFHISLPALNKAEKPR